MKEKKTYYVTTPIYYTNGDPHIGHAYTNIVSDVLARFKRLDNYKVLFLTGTDEHGQKVESSALSYNQSPQEFVDNIAEKFQSLCSMLHITHDIFVRTTQTSHKLAVTQMWNLLDTNGHIYLGTYEGWYSMRDEAFYTDAELIKIDNKLVAPSGSEVEWRKEESYFFKLSKFQEALLDFYEAHKDFITPKSRYNEVVSFVKGGLQDLSISRSSCSWGISVPNDPKHVVYVWLDALTNYLTGALWPEDMEYYSAFWPCNCHMVGKDILRFHAVYWPAFLLGANLPLSKRIAAHGWWLNEEQKISKSLGNTIDPVDLVHRYGVDQLRFFFLKEITFGNDGNFSHEALLRRSNNELSNEYGNLVQRVFTIIYNNFDVLHSPCFSDEQVDILNSIDELLSDLRTFMDEQNFSKYIDSIWYYIRYANSYINDKAPWQIIKQGNLEDVKPILYFLVEIIRKVTIILHPFIPLGTTTILTNLGIDTTKLTLSDVTNTIADIKISSKPQPVFPKIVI